MSANLDLVKSLFATWSKGDYRSNEWADPEIEYEMVGGLTEGSWTGIAEMGKAWGSMVSAWEDLRAVPDEFRELDDGRVLVFLRNTGRGKGSGVEIDEISIKAANLFTVRDGKVTRLVIYWDRAQAISDLGLDRTEPD